MAPMCPLELGQGTASEQVCGHLGQIYPCLVLLCFIAILITWMSTSAAVVFCRAGFAMMEAILVVASVVQQYRLRPSNPGAAFPLPKPLITLRPESVPLLITRR